MITRAYKECSKLKVSQPSGVSAGQGRVRSGRASLVCLSLSHCSLDFSALLMITRACKECSKLKVSQPSLCRSGRGLCRSGTGSLQVGTGSPQVGTGSLQVGTGSLQVGKGSPQVGDGFSAGRGWGLHRSGWGPSALPTITRACKECSKLQVLLRSCLQ